LNGGLHLKIRELFRKSPTRRVLMFGPAATTVPTGARLLMGNPDFRDAFMQASEYVEAHRGWSLWRALDSDSPPEGVTSSERNFVQEVVLQLALFRALDAVGVEYEAVAGISLGDGAAAHAAGSLSFEDTLLVTCETIRAVLCASGGDLVAVQTSPSRVREVVEDPNVALIFDWPVMSVWAVPDDSAKKMQRQLRVAGIPYARLGLNCLSHTKRVDVEGLARGLAALPDRAPERRLYSTLEGGLAPSSITRERVVRMISEPVKLDAMWQAMRDDGFTDLLYIGSIPADLDLFRKLPRASQPTSFTKAESCIAIADVPDTFGISIGEDAWPANIAAAIRSSAFARDPYSYYQRWSANGTVHQLPGESIYVVLGYDAVASVLKNVEVYSSNPAAQVSPILMGSDPPDHTRFRRLLSPLFARERQLEERESIGRITAIVLHDLRKTGKFDAVPNLATKIPFSVACHWLGLNERHAATLGAMAPEEVSWPDVERALKPGGALATLIESSELSRDEIQRVMPFLLLAGATTSRDLILHAMHALLSKRSLFEQVSADPSLIPLLTEEMLRCEPPVHGLVRRVKSDVTLDGVDIPAGSTVWAMIAAANRDPSKFERADELILGRKDGKHMSFGHGPHFCMGSYLGRAENEVIVEALLPELTKFHGPPPEFVVTDMREDLPLIRSMRSWQLEYGRR
jgi:cytochrome P450